MNKKLNKKDFEKLTHIQKEYALGCQNLGWFKREDFKKLNYDQKEYALIYQNLSWFKREDFEKLTHIQKECALRSQNLGWFKIEDFEKLTDYQKECALRSQNLGWFKREDFEKLNYDQKKYAIEYQNFSWFTKKLLGNFYKVHKKQTKKQCLKEIKGYAKKYNLEFDGEYLFAFREHDKFGRGKFKRIIFYKKGKYYRDWRLNADEKNENSFGLGIFSKGNTPVKVHIDDWGCRVNNSNKCRVWGFTILN